VNFNVKYAMGGPILVATYASRGIYPGQEIQKGVGAGAVFDGSPFGFIYDEAGSRCEQYGGHWSRGKCVGRLGY
jgi:hypothetical protein